MSLPKVKSDVVFKKKQSVWLGQAALVTRREVFVTEHVVFYSCQMGIYESFKTLENALRCARFSSTAAPEPGEDPRVTRAKYFIRDEFLVRSRTKHTEARSLKGFFCIKE